MSSGPKVSFIVPVFNTEEQLGECLDSIVSQSEEDIEVILVNDGSTDRSGKICDAYSRNDERVHVIHQDNQGSGSARNRGLEAAKGDYICFVDSDDKIDYKLAEENYKKATQDQSDIVVFGYSIKLVDSGKEVWVRSDLMEEEYDSGRDSRIVLASILESGGRLSIWNKLFRRELIQMHGVRFPDLQRGQDVSFALDSLRYAQRVSVNDRRYYQHFKSKPYLIDPETPESHILLFKKYKAIYSGRPEEFNNSYSIKLLVLWFFYLSPILIVKNKEYSLQEKLNRLRRITNSTEITGSVKTLELKRSGNFSSFIGFAILKLRSAYLIYLTAILNMIVKGSVGTAKLKRVFNR